MCDDEQLLQIAHGRIAYLEDQVRGLQESLAAAEALVFSHEGHIARLTRKVERRDQELSRIDFIAGQIPLDLDNQTLRRALMRAVERQRIAEDLLQFCTDVLKEVDTAGVEFTTKLAALTKKIGEKTSV
jgi:hypothetical protein